MTATVPAYVINRDFPAMPRTAFQMDRHYLLYARTGTMRLEHNGQQWSLPPARAALIAANTPIWISISHPLTACSALFDAQTIAPPHSKLSVFDMSPLGRELVLACKDFGQDDTNRPLIAKPLFAALQSVTWERAETPSLAVMPLGQSDPVRKALDWTAAHLEQDLTFSEVAGAVSMTPRSLARRFASELGQPWGQVVRKMRMMKAGEELAMTDAQITQIALSVGYSSLSAFNTAFRNFSGVSPSRYRDDLKLKIF